MHAGGGGASAEAVAIRSRRSTPGVCTRALAVLVSVTRVARSSAQLSNDRVAQPLASPQASR